MTKLFYVQDARTYVGNSVMWWCPEGKGYTTHIDLAGLYTEEEIRTMRNTDIPWAQEDVDKIWSHHVDMQMLRRLRCSNPRCVQAANPHDRDRFCRTKED